MGRIVIITFLLKVLGVQVALAQPMMCRELLDLNRLEKIQTQKIQRDTSVQITDNFKKIGDVSKAIKIAQVEPLEIKTIAKELLDDVLRDGSISYDLKDKISDLNLKLEARISTIEKLLTYFKYHQNKTISEISKQLEVNIELVENKQLDWVIQYSKNHPQLSIQEVASHNSGWEALRVRLNTQIEILVQLSQSLNTLVLKLEKEKSAILSLQKLSLDQTDAPHQLAQTLVDLTR